MKNASRAAAILAVALLAPSSVKADPPLVPHGSNEAVKTSIAIDVPVDLQGWKEGRPFFPWLPVEANVQCAAGTGNETQYGVASQTDLVRVARSGGDPSAIIGEASAPIALDSSGNYHGTLHLVIQGSRTGAPARSYACILVRNGRLAKNLAISSQLQLKDQLTASTVYAGFHNAVDRGTISGDAGAQIHIEAALLAAHQDPAASARPAHRS